MSEENQITTTSSPRLVQISEPHSGTEYVLEKELFTLGREKSNHLSFPADDSISRQHARINQKFGLIWLEDLGSTNGSFVTPPGGPERKLEPNSPALLVENSQVRLGRSLRFEVHDTISTQDEAAKVVCQRLQYMLLEIYQRIQQLPPQEKKRHLDAIHSLEKQLAEVGGAEELAFLAADGLELMIKKLNTVQVRGNSFARTTPAPDLPPLPDNLPDPYDENRLRTIMNVFITDIHLCFPPDKNNEQP